MVIYVCLHLLYILFLHHKDVQNAVRISSGRAFPWIHREVESFRSCLLVDLQERTALRKNATHQNIGFD